MGSIQVEVPPLNGVHQLRSQPNGTAEPTLKDKVKVAVEDVTEPLFQPPNYANPKNKLIDRYVDEPRELRVAVLGAGLSGVLSGILLPAKVPGIKLTIFEKNADVVSLPDATKPGVSESARQG